jgi:riboflavin kinase/FMN adenylyltransferase
VRPTFGDEDGKVLVETHLLDFQGDLYGKVMRLTFVDRLRDEQRFSGPDELIRQITRDIRHARRLMDRVPVGKMHG